MHPAHLAALLFLLPAFAAGSTEPPPQPGRQALETPRPFFYRLAQQITTGDTLERFDFATIALSELTAAYQASYRKSLQESSTRERQNHKLARWRRGLDQYIARLNEQREALDYNSRIEIVIPAQGPISLFLDDDPVVISGPELARARQLEQRIVDRFCLLHDCSSYREQPVEPAIEMPRVGVGSWQFQHRRGARYRTPDGLEFPFHSVDNRQAKQRFCEAIAADLRLLVNRIRNARRDGYPVDWSALRIRTLYDGDTEHVTINQAGDYLSMDLLYFNDSRQPTPELLTWARERAAGREATVIINNAEQMLSLYRPAE